MYLCIYDDYRLIGMTPLFISSDCYHPWRVIAVNHSWPYFANPIVLFCTFTVISMDYAYYRGKRVSSIPCTFRLTSSSLYAYSPTATPQALIYKGSLHHDDSALLN